MHNQNMVVYSTQSCILITQVHGKVPQESPFLIPFTAVLVALCNKACNCVALLLVMEGSCHVFSLTVRHRHQGTIHRRCGRNSILWSTGLASRMSLCRWAAASQSNLPASHPSPSPSLAFSMLIWCVWHRHQGTVLWRRSINCTQWGTILVSPDILGVAIDTRDTKGR